MKKITLLFIILTLASCRYFNVSPVNGITTNNLTKKPSQLEMIGIWEVDKFSYDLIEKKGFVTKKIELKLKSNGTFEISNLPNFINEFDQTKEKYINTTGTWEIRKDSNKEYWILNMFFDKSNFYENGISTYYDLYLQDDNIIIWTFIGDPDSGERFLFTKK